MTPKKETSIYVTVGLTFLMNLCIALIIWNRTASANDDAKDDEALKTEISKKVDFDTYDIKMKTFDKELTLKVNQDVFDQHVKNESEVIDRIYDQLDEQSRDIKAILKAVK